MVNLQEIGFNLINFCSFFKKAILDIGAGEGALLEYYLPCASRIIAFDKDERKLINYHIKAIKFLMSKNLGGKVQINTETNLAFLEFSNLVFDVALFVFSLHEFENFKEILDLAKNHAYDLVVIDHSPESEWSYYCAEDEKVKQVWEELRRLRGQIKKTECVAYHFFSNYEELKQKICQQENIIEKILALERIKIFEGENAIKIQMPYTLFSFSESKIVEAIMAQNA